MTHYPIHIGFAIVGYLLKASVHLNCNPPIISGPAGRTFPRAHWALRTSSESDRFKVPGRLVIHQIPHARAEKSRLPILAATKPTI